MRTGIRAALLGTMLALPLGGVAMAQPVPPHPVGHAQFDLQQLPAVNGTIAHYTLTPRGDVDGFVMQDGTEVHVPPHLSAQLVYAAKPGDRVTVHGLRALNEKMVAAASVTNDATGATVSDNGMMGGPHPGPANMQPMRVQGVVAITLHGPRGEVNGAMLQDGTVLRLPPPEAGRFAGLLQPGATVAAEGDGVASALGRVLAVREIGPNPTQLAAVHLPPPHGHHGPHHPRGPGADGPDMPPPPPPRG